MTDPILFYLTPRSRMAFDACCRKIGTPVAATNEIIFALDEFTDTGMGSKENGCM